MIAFASPVPAYSVLPEASLGSTTSEPSALVGRPAVTACHVGCGSRPLFVRQMPPPAAATHTRQPEPAPQFWSMASAVMRPEVIESRRLSVVGPGATPTVGPRNSHGLRMRPRSRACCVVVPGWKSLTPSCWGRSTKARRALRTFSAVMYPRGSARSWKASWLGLRPGLPP